MWDVVLCLYYYSSMAHKIIVTVLVPKIFLDCEYCFIWDEGVDAMKWGVQGVPVVGDLCSWGRTTGSMFQDILSLTQMFILQNSTICPPVLLRILWYKLTEVPKQKN